MRVAVVRYITRDGDVLDRVCHRHYGRSDCVLQVFEANPGLVDRPMILPAGLVIELPAIRKEPQEQLLRLWD